MKWKSAKSIYWIQSKCASIWDFMDFSCVQRIKLVIKLKHIASKYAVKNGNDYFACCLMRFTYLEFGKCFHQHLEFPSKKKQWKQKCTRFSATKLTNQSKLENVSALQQIKCINTTWLKSVVFVVANVNWSCNQFVYSWFLLWYLPLFLCIIQS